MRERVPHQRKLTPSFVDHEHSKELQKCSDLLDAKPEILNLVYSDLVCGLSKPQKGRLGMTAEQVLRALVLKQMEDYSYDELAYHLQDSTSARAFCRLGFAEKPGKTSLWRSINRVSAATLEQINRAILGIAAECGVEQGRKVRIDTSVVETNIHHPSDSSLLWDSVRALTMRLEKASVFGIQYTDHRKRAKRRALAVLNAKNADERTEAYRDLLDVAGWTASYASNAIPKLLEWRGTELLDDLAARELAWELSEFVGLAKQVIGQAHRRLFLEESVPAAEKIVSIFEPHTDIIRKDRRDTEFGHKTCFTFGRSSMILDCLVLKGNPPDSTLGCLMIDRQDVIYGRVPRQAAYDAGFASKAQLAAIKERGVKDVVFHKKQGLQISEMAKSTWVYKRLRRFRAGAEGCISFLKRCFGLGRCTWRGFENFKAYVWASAVSANLLILARHLLKPTS